MSISTYSELKSTIADYLNRDDLTGIIPTFIALAEANINRSLRHMKMETRASGQQDAGDRFMEIPTDWLETIRFAVTDAGTSPITLISRDDMADKRAKAENADTSTPAFYSMIDQQFELYPTPSSTINVELSYYKKIPALSDSNTSNWLLADAPDVYLYGALLHSAPYLQEDERAQVWAQLYSAGMQTLQSASDTSRYSGSGLKMKVRGLG